MVRCIYDDLVGADAVHHVEYPQALFIEGALYLQGGEFVRHDPHGPTGGVRGAGFPVRYYLGRSHRLVPVTERAAVLLLLDGLHRKILGRRYLVEACDYPTARYRVSAQLVHEIFISFSDFAASSGGMGLI